MKVVRVAGAAKIVDVDRRTVYNYVKKRKVYAVKVAGSTLRVCSHCLLREDEGHSSATQGDYSITSGNAA